MEDTSHVGYGKWLKIQQAESFLQFTEFVCINGMLGFFWHGRFAVRNSFGRLFYMIEFN